MKNWKRLAIVCMPLGVFVSKAFGQEERPNILFLTFEDSSANLFGCYGGKFAKTPNVDNLASQGIQYTNVWSAAPQSSPARSSLITGAYATTYAMDMHRNHQKTPDNILFPQLLRNAGYYCTNNVKTDYNTSIDNKSCWDESSKDASYNSPKRQASQPFFAVFNCMASHMGRIRSFHTDGRRDYSKEGLNTDALVLPPYLPDLPQVRSDYAGHLEAIQDIDEWLSYFLKDLKEKNLDENTIIFFFSDHGGCLPRGKGYLYESGLKVPFIVYLPPKWAHLSTSKAGDKSSRSIDFTDIAPTLLNLSGINIPEQIKGRAFLGKESSIEKEYNHAFTTNQHHVYMPSRAVTDGRFKYIRRYIPYKYLSLRNYYQWGMPSNMAWDKLIMEGCATEILSQPYKDNETELLFDLENDPNEINNLAENPAYQDKLNELRKETSNHIRKTKDLGFFIPSSRSETVNLFDKANKENYPLEELYQLVEKASLPQKNDLKFFSSYLNNKENEFRFWASVGIATLASRGEIRNAPSQLQKMIEDQDDYVAAEACYGLIKLNKYTEQALKRLVTPKNEFFRKAGYSLLEVLSLKNPTRQQISKDFVIAELERSAQTINITDNEDSGLIASGILVNLGLKDIKDMYGKDAYQLGLSTNKGRRKKLPLP